MILKELKIDTWKGSSTNCYIVFDEKSTEALVVDPAGDIDRIEEMLNILGAKLKYIFIPDGSTIDNSAFDGLTNLTIIGDSDKTIEMYALEHGFNYFSVTN